MSDQLKKIFKKCNPHFSERTLDILHYPFKKGTDLKEVIIFLKSRKFSVKELNMIREIWKYKYPQNHELDNYIEMIQKIKNNKSNLKKYSLFNQLIKLGEKSNSLFLKYLLLSVGYGQIGNKGLMGENFKKLLSLNEILYTTDLYQSFVSEKNKDKYYSLINDLFGMLRSVIEDKKLVRILDTNFSFLDIKNEKIKFVADDGNWSLNELRENMNTSLYGIIFPSFWMKSVINRISYKEQVNFVTKLEKIKILRGINILDYWIFKDNLPPNDQIRTHIVNSIDHFYGKNLTSDYVILELLEDSVFKKNLSVKNINFKKPIFTLKRNLYHSALEDGRETSYPILKLVEMGEENERLIWWLIL